MSITVDAVRMLHEASERLNDSWYSIRTAGHLLQAQAGVAHPDANEYAATPYRVIRRLFRSLPPHCFDGSFIDYGSGRGRVTIMASGYSFRRVIGIELSDILTREAQENLRSTRLQRRCTVELLRTDAAQFEVPDDATVVYLYKPFGPVTTEHVLRRVAESLRRRPRELWILGYNAALLLEMAGSLLGAEIVRVGTTVYPTIAWAAMRVRQ
jgi:SAM-dependent methyltransferase